MGKKDIPQIDSCRSCDQQNLVDVLFLGKQYLSDFITNSKKPHKYPLELVLCSNCNLVQLKHTVPQSQLYTERYGYRSSINQTMRDELREIVTQSLKIVKKEKNMIVVDIGANDGTLISNYGKEMHKIAIEPIKKFADESEKYANVVINDFFSYSAYAKVMKKQKSHLITAISCFYDMEDPNTFVKDIKKILHKQGIFVIQQNYLVSMLQQNAFDNIVHEHLEYYSLLSLERLLKKHKLEVFHVELTNLNGGSFRTFIAHKNEYQVKKTVIALREQEEKIALDKKETYQAFAKRVRENKKAIFDIIQKIKKEGKKIYVYGASTRGNTLLQFYNLDNNLITAAIERNPEKWGKRIASVDIPIISEEQARKERPDYMLVLPWFFKEEFLQREKEYLASGGHFIFPLPSVEII